MPTNSTLKYCESLKLPVNSEKLENYKRKRRERDLNYRKRKVESTKSEKFKRKRSQQANDCRKRKALNLKSKGYSSTEGLRKATKKIEKELPEDFKKRVQIVQKLSEKYKICDQIETESEEEDSDENFEPVMKKTHKEVMEFYSRNTISHQMPGMKNFKSVKVEGRGRERKQVSYMLNNTTETYDMYKSEFGDEALAKSTFKKLRPPFILPAGKTPHDFCVCKYHQDADLMFKTLSKFIETDIIEEIKDLVIKLTCCSSNFECMSGRCEECKNFSFLLQSIFKNEDMSVKITFEQWDCTGIPQRVTKVSTLGGLIEKFNENFPQYKLHSYIASSQHEALKVLKDNLEVRKSFHFFSVLRKMKK